MSKRTFRDDDGSYYLYKIAPECASSLMMEMMMMMMMMGDERTDGLSDGHDLAVYSIYCVKGEKNLSSSF